MFLQTKYICVIILCTIPAKVSFDTKMGSEFIIRINSIAN